MSGALNSRPVMYPMRLMHTYASIEMKCNDAYIAWYVYMWHAPYDVSKTYSMYRLQQVKGEMFYEMDQL
jgi:hypothetical protein